MPRIVLSFLALALTAAAGDGKAEFEAAKKALEEVYFEKLDPAERERLLRAVAGWDSPRAIPIVAQVAARYGVYVTVVQGELPKIRKELEPLQGRRALTADEMKQRQALISKLEFYEARWRRARSSMDRMAIAVGKYKNKKTIQKAIRDLQRNRSAHVQYLFVRSCAHWHAALLDAKLSRQLLAALRKMSVAPDPGVRVAVARSLLAFKRQEAVDLLGKILEDKDWAVRAASVRSLALAANAPAITYLIDAMMKEEGRLQDDINTVLERLTGQNFKYPESWARWWASVGRQIPKKRPVVGAGKEALKAGDSARFYGIPTRSERICFIIDISGSMKKEVDEAEAIKKSAPVTGKQEKRHVPATGKTRIEVAKNELSRAISNLNPKKQFNIVFFNTAVKAWRKEMALASSETKAEARKEIKTVVPGGVTYTLGALREAFTIAGALDPAYKIREGGSKVDTIFLLSDGGPTELPKSDEVKPMDPQVILETVRQWNRDAGIVIHCIAVDTEATGTFFLQQLAEQNGGVFVERKW